MAKYLGISKADFEASYCQPNSGVTGWRRLQSKLMDAQQVQGQQQREQEQQQQQVSRRPW
jgi:hypothetical protein